MKIPTMQLPDLPSELIMEALADLRATEKNKAFTIDMGRWHSPVNDEKNKNVCCVCFAGAIMAQKCNAPNEVIRPGTFDNKTRNKLLSLDALRNYEIKPFVQYATDNYDYDHDLEDVLYKIYNLLKASPIREEEYGNQYIEYNQCTSGNLCHIYEEWPTGFKQSSGR